MAIMIPAWVNGALQPVEKLAAHQRGLRHKAVSIFVLHGQEILIQQRALCKYHTPGLWANTCCTHPDWGEDSADCARRRLNEELGINGLPLEHRGQVEYRADVGDGLIEHELVDVFIAQVDTYIPTHANPDEVMSSRWVPHHALVAQITQMPQLFTPWLRIYLSSHADMIFGDKAAI